MLAFTFVLNYLCCLVFAVAVMRRLLPERETAYVGMFESAVAGSLLYCVEVFFFTETLSLLNLLKTPGPLALLFFVAAVLLAGVTFFHRDSLSRGLSAWKSAPSKPAIRKIVYFIVFLIVLPLLFVAVYYPPCTADSMSYHLPRILHWIENGNVAGYPTNYNRQLYVQPFGEYLVLPWELMTGGDWFDNTVQIMALVGVLLLTALLIRHFGGSAWCQMLGITIVLSSPILIFEAPTTQTDIILTFFFFSFIYSGLKLSSARERNDMLFYAICMGVSLGLSLNTKLSVAPFELVFCSWFGWRFLTVHRRKVWTIYAILVAGFLVFNVPYFYRNYQISGSPFGEKHLQDQVRNMRFGLDVVFSNTTRNIGMQLLVPFQAINVMNYGFLQHLHRELGIPWDDPRISFTGMGTTAYPYTPGFILDDYRSGNTLIVVLLFIVSLSLGGETLKRNLFPADLRDPNRNDSAKKKEKKRPEPPKNPDEAETPLLVQTQPVLQRELTVYTWLMFFGFILFSAMFRWQPFGSRLLLPALLGTTPFVAVGLCRLMEPKWIYRLTVLSLGISTLFVVFLVSNSLFYDPLGALISVAESKDFEKPVADGFGKDAPRENAENVVESTYVTNIELIEDYFRPDRTWSERIRFQRNYKYFRIITYYLADYMSIANQIEELGAVNVGMALDPVQDRWEYPFWPILRSKNPAVRIKWVVFPDYLRQTYNFDPDFVPDVIITDYPPEVLQEKFDIEHAWKYDYLVLAKVGKTTEVETKDPDTQEPEAEMTTDSPEKPAE